MEPTLKRAYILLDSKKQTFLLFIVFLNVLPRTLVSKIGR